VIKGQEKDKMNLIINVDGRALNNT